MTRIFFLKIKSKIYVKFYIRQMTNQSNDQPIIFLSPARTAVPGVPDRFYINKRNFGRQFPIKKRAKTHDFGCQIFIKKAIPAILSYKKG